ncbi:unnamed protein product [Effrenium voratum]|uniref:CS domain-containing protein n=1 Tax=Effrenium voratum TaxID=2562239 RepID=A0AA36N9Z5_9DINO|nr:unnamed protein product [Effrenium voratum]CAJ1423894.1 unnamed protein product [Effrenium voratum]
MASLSIMRVLRFMLGPPGVPLWIVLAFDTIMLMIVLGVLLLLLPKTVLAKSKLVRVARNRLTRWLGRIVELSMQGPLVAGTVWLGKKLGKGRLSSVPKAPHGISVKADSMYEVTVKISPTKGWNLFHEEDFVVAFARDGTDVWAERSFSRMEDCEDLSGSLKKGDRFKMVIPGLPACTRIKFRACAVSYWGRGPWGKEATASTMAKPSADLGFTGPLGPAWEKTGSDKNEYTWLQTRNEVHIRIPIGKDIRGKDVKFKALPHRIQVDLAVGESLQLLHGQLAHRINSDDATWYIDESKDHGRYIQVTVFKLEALERWTRVFEGDEHPEVDPRLIQWFVDPLNPGTLGDLDE